VLRSNENVEGDQLPEQRPWVLRAVLRVAAGARVAGPRVEAPVRAKHELAPVVVRVRVVEEQQLPHAPDRLLTVRAVLDDPRVAPVVGVLDVEEPVLRVARVERKPEQALLAARGDLAVDVEERPCAHAPVLEDDDLAVLEHDVDATPLATRSDHLKRGVEPRRDPDDSQLLEPLLRRPAGVRVLPVVELVAEERRCRDDHAQGDDLAHERPTREHGRRRVAVPVASSSAEPCGARPHGRAASRRAPGLRARASVPAPGPRRVRRA
jgi:hypothetical protein